MFTMFLMTAMLGQVPVLSPVRPVTLKCEYRTNPLGMEAVQPRLSWRIESKRREEVQTAYQIVAADSPGRLKIDGDLWDTGKVFSSQSQHLTYEGKTLHSGQRVWWKIRIWDKDGTASAFSEPASWEMGMLHAADWKAQWIGLNNPGGKKDAPPASFLRKTFQSNKSIRSARLYASAKGVYTFLVNGTKVSNDLFRPGWTDYKKRIQYQTYDVTKLIRHGENALGVVLGDGWYSGHVCWAGRQNYGPVARALVQLKLDFTDGSTQTIVSDGSWKGNTGPILFSDMLMGESYDARKEMPGWAAPGFQDNSWQSVAVESETPSNPTSQSPLLVAQCGPSVLKVAELTPKTITEKPAGAYVVDLGQNMVGWARLKVKGAAGATVRLRFAEILNPDGTVYTTNLRGAKCTDTYTLKGGGEEIYEPSFTFHGFRYVEVTGYPGKPDNSAITGIAVSSAHAQTGTFACSSPMVNQLQSNILWGQRGNYLEVPTDCPQRDERLGWMGDAQVFIRTACFNEDVADFMTKWTQDVVDAQSPEGGFADVSPRIGGLGNAAPAWGDAGVIVPWTLYLYYGDTRLLAERYASMVKWIEYIHGGNPDLLWKNRSGNNYGDWLNINADTPREIIGTAYFAYSTHLVSKIARVLGKTEDAEKYDTLFENIRLAFTKNFVQDDGRIVNKAGKGDTQTCYLLGLHFDLLPADKRVMAERRLIADVVQKHDNHLTTGFVGVGYLTPTLTQIGQTDVAYRLLNNDTFPSWGYSIKQGATTIWERWDGWTKEKGFQDAGMNSFNHYSLGSVGAWMYNTVAGIDLDPASPGYKHFLLHPQPGGGLTNAKASYESLYGKIVSDWRMENGKFLYTITIPANTTATVTIPAKSAEAVTEGGMFANKAEGVHFLKAEDGQALYEVGSGNYSFVVAP